MRKQIGINERGLRVGEDHQNAKLTDAEVEMIRELHSEGTQGRATNDDFNLLISALNVTEALMMQELGAEYSPELKAGQDALRAIGERFKKIKRFVLRAEEMSALNLAMDVHDAQLEICTVAQIERAIHTVRRVVTTGKATAI